MELHRRSLRLVALAVVVSLPLLGTSGVASAKVKPAKGCHKTHTCKTAGGGGTGTGGGTGAAVMTVQMDPNHVVEVSQSNVNVVIQVETNASFAGDQVVISSSQFQASCASLYFNSAQAGSGGVPYGNTYYVLNAPITLTLDNDGNATVEANGYTCAPGTDIIEADLAVAPFLTALGTLTVSPPAVTPTGVFGYPTTSGTVTTGEVETGDTAASGDSDVYAVFYVETDPVYAEQPVEISDTQLEDSCITGFAWYDSETLFLTSDPEPLPKTTLDDDGNAVFVFVGSSCAATTSDVIADVLAGTNPTYTTTFTVLAPQPTI
jgi:hypothetical protein